MSDERRPRRLWKPIALIVVIVALFVAAVTLDVGAYLQQAQDEIAALGPWGPLAFIALYVVATTLMVPGTAMTAIAGALFRGFWGTIYVSIGATIGAGVCFLIARYFARGAVAEWLATKATFRKLDAMTETHGGWMVAITRLVPIFPFNLLNYGFGLTRVHFGTYLLLSWLCMLPGTALYVYGFDAIATGFREGRVPWGLVGIVAVVLIGLIALTWVARGKLRGAGIEADDDAAAIEGDALDAGDGA